ncbi:VOC family protein (plasmid) [Paraburkholderia sprentiae WSM5005]|uniref:VOC family protein n=1 Tax=Paraburkholderia sprentiae WSM5005 TaxID=754502 RepID=A0A1I9YTU9_9BURK|nr:VOC family protein [Paraburkholderia sprentiae]APA89623.1 VOC family protein [Paraburkholderia sprentiae WSM5005]
MKTPSLSPFSGFLQIAYVTTDVDEAIERFCKEQKVPAWARLPGIEIESIAGRRCKLNIALAFVGSVQLELIEPLCGDDRVYRDALPRDRFAIRHHHIAQLIESEAAFETQREDMAAAGVPIVIDGQSRGYARYFYSDHRGTLGHYIEHIWYTPAGLVAMDQVPRNGVVQ